MEKIIFTFILSINSCFSTTFISFVNTIIYIHINIYIIYLYIKINIFYPLWQ